MRAQKALDASIAFVAILGRNVPSRASRRPSILLVSHSGEDGAVNSRSLRAQGSRPGNNGARHGKESDRSEQHFFARLHRRCRLRRWRSRYCVDSRSGRRVRELSSRDGRDAASNEVGRRGRSAEANRSSDCPNRRTAAIDGDNRNRDRREALHCAPHAASQRCATL